MGEKNVSIKEEPLLETSGVDADSAVSGEALGGVSRQLFGDGDRLKEETEEVVKPETRRKLEVGTLKKKVIVCYWACSMHEHMDSNHVLTYQTLC